MKAKALLVEDDPAWAEILEELLSEEGFNVHSVDSLEAFRQLDSGMNFRLALVDLSLESSDHRNQDGLVILAELQSGQRAGKAILLTGFATVELAVSVITEGMAATCLRKESFERAAFRESIRELVTVAPQGPGALLVEDEEHWQELLAELLQEGGFQVVTCSSYGQALSVLRRGDFRLAVVDLSLSSSLNESNQDGLRLVRQAQKAGLTTVVVSGTGDLGTIDDLVTEENVRAYFEKQNFERAAFLRLVETCNEPSPLEKLTERELEVLELLAEGLTNSQIAERLFISANTVKRHLKTVFEKLEVSNRAAAATLLTSQRGQT